LYFIDEILVKCEEVEIKNFMIELIEKWIYVDMRDFNVRGYVCKFVMHFLDGGGKDGKNWNREDGYGILLSFFRELKY
jgi:hypothetical protein